MSKIDLLNIAAKDALKDGYLDEAIKHSSELIETVRKQMVNALELRTRIWEKMAKLEQELSDTLMITEYDGEKTDAYLHAASVYSIQGKQHKARMILEKALESLPNEDEHDMIHEQITKANERLERRVDFVTETPFDILCKIMEYLDFEAVLNCMEVCVTWRDRISQCPEPWKNVPMRTVQFWKGHNKAEILSSVSHHIKRLFLSYPDDLNEDVEIFRHLNLCRMETFDISFYSSSKVDHSIISTICDTVYRTEHRLTSLRIDGPMSIPSIGQILSGCPALEILQLYVHAIHDWTTGLPSNTLLTSAYINISKFPVDANDLKPFFRCSPNLMRVQVCPGYRFLNYDRRPIDILPALQDHCPQLISIENFSGHNRPDYYVRNETFDGLKCVALANIRSALPLYSRLERATDSLRSLHITTLNGALDSTLADWRPLSAFTLNSLEYLGIDADPNSALYQNLPNILRSCPAVETLRLKSNTYARLPEETANQIFTAAIGLEKLSCLHLRCFVIHGQGFRQLMQHHARQNTIRVIEIEGLIIDCTFLQDIARIKALEFLHIHDVNVDQYPEADVTEFARLVSQLPILRSLTLSDMNLSVEAARYLRESPAPFFVKLTNYGEDLSEDAYEILKDIIYDDRDDYDNYYDDDEEDQEDEEGDQENEEDDDN